MLPASSPFPCVASLLPCSHFSFLSFRSRFCETLQITTPLTFLFPQQLLKCRRLCDFHCFFPAHCWITSPPPSFPPFSVVLSVASPSSSHKSFVFLFWRTVIGQKTIGECEYPSAMTIMPFSSGMESKRKLERMGLLCEGGSLWSGGSE